MLVCILGVMPAARAQLPEIVSTPQASASAQSLCSGGPSDGQSCETDGDCAGGACVHARGVCDRGSLDGKVCDCNGGRCSSHPVCPTTHGSGTCDGGAFAGSCCDLATDCGGGVAACVGTQRICLSGGSAGSPCLSDQHCPGGTCGSSGLVCSGGANDGFTCNVDSDCPDGRCIMPIVDTPTPRPTSSILCVDPNAPTPAAAKGQFRCEGKIRSGHHCLTNMDCRRGVCVVAEGVCDGGPNDGMGCDCPGAVCEAEKCPSNPTLGRCTAALGPGHPLCCNPNLQCGGAPCVPTAKFCAGGSRRRIPCLSDSQCPGSGCVSTASFCDGGKMADYSCVVDANCTGGSCPAPSFPDIPTCRPDQLPTATPTRLPTRTPNSPQPQPSRTPIPAGGSAGSAAGTATSGGTSCAIDPTGTAIPWAPLAILVVLRASRRRWRTPRAFGRAAGPVGS